MLGLKNYAQSPILNLYTQRLGEIENAYYKDVTNLHNQFVGTWVYIDANKTIRLRFKKREMVYTNYSKGCYVDYLVGEAQYIENGIEKLNSLNNLNINYADIFKYNIVDITKVTYDYYPICNDCPHDVARLLMNYDEATNDDDGFSRNLFIARVTENGVPKLKIQFALGTGQSGQSKSNNLVDSTTLDFTVPYGNYTLTKED